MAKQQMAADLNMACADCRAQLNDYVNRELTGEPVATLFPVMTYHIETCPGCEAAYFAAFHAQGMQKSLEELRQLGDRATTGAALDRARSTLAPSAGWDARPVSHGHAWYDPLTGSLRRLELQLAGLLFGPPQAPAAVLQGLQTGPAAADGLVTPGAVISASEAEVAVRILPDAGGDATRLRVEVNVEVEGRLGDFSGIEVVLRDAWADHGARTDELGKVTFVGIERSAATTLDLTIRLPEPDAPA